VPWKPLLLNTPNERFVKPPIAGSVPVNEFERRYLNRKSEITKTEEGRE